MIDAIINAIVNLIDYSGYPGIFILMTLESALIPIPSEIIMPFSGYLVYSGRFDFFLTVLAGTLGNLFGSVIAYYAGKKLGRSWIEKYVKFMHKEKMLEKFDAWFKKYGDAVAFFSRLMPAVRTFVSFPLGVANVKFSRFCIFTFLGSVFWTMILTYIGVLLGPHWQEMLDVFHEFEIIILGALALGFVYFYLKKKW